ncbi:hypothetical protein GA0115254_124826 [Streptomyces sp. Ncost-T10-10d]|nr:hypothetical protein GA0115254_124826 [Streptomyces sp. Ncost-T10-10d]
MTLTPIPVTLYNDPYGWERGEAARTDRFLRQPRPMRPRSSYKAPPSQSLIYSAVLQSMAEHGPRRMNMALAARIADTDRQLLYRNWPDRNVLVRESAESELQRVLFVASDLRSEQEGLCRVAEQIVRAARMAREHPVTRTTVRTDPDLLRSALLDTDTRLHGRARYWLGGLFPGPLARTIPHMYRLPDVLLTVAAPFALTPPEEPHTDSERSQLDARLRTALHMCLGIAPDCPCTATPP